MPAPLPASPTLTPPAPAAIPPAGLASPHAPRDGGEAATRFDRHLDQARKQPSPSSPDDARVASQPAGAQDKAPAAGGNDAPATDGDARAGDAATVPPAVAGAAATQHGEARRAVDARADDGSPQDDAAEADGDPAAAVPMLPAAMLALLGQAAPTALSSATGGIAKVMSAMLLKTTAAHVAANGKAAGAAMDDTLSAAGSADGAAVDEGGLSGMSNALGTSEVPAAATLSQSWFAAAGVGTVPAHKASEAARGADLTALAAAPLQAMPAAAAPAAMPHLLTANNAAGTPAFAQELGQQVAWLAGQDVKQARIRLHPEELGALEVKLNVTHDRVDVSFAVQHPATVHMLQQTLPQLDTLLAQQGLSLGDAQVGQQAAHQSAPQGMPGESAGEGVGEVAEEGGALPPLSAAGSGLLDAFA
ncbi:flagellar hook-length control protein FliK [Frateuria defendens]|uniref:flagellar hook-length control protein FliK n=1 Tax=Frateuria defendens TaxID=2219559 RepID=UPI00066FB7D6|nr:flagellar hook-length control protein FliK [Frateuria defendens]